MPIRHGASLSALSGSGPVAVVALDAGGPLTGGAVHEGLVDVGLMFITDPTIEAAGLVERVDARGLEPAVSITPVVRIEIVERWGTDLVAVIESISARLTTRLGGR